MSDTLLSTLLVGVAICYSIGFALFPMFKKVKWHEEMSDGSWKKVTAVALLFAVGGPLLIINGIDDKTDYWRMFASAVTAGLVSVVMAYSWTDFAVRKVDRRVLNIASFSALVASSAYTITHWDKYTAIAAGSMILLGVIIYVFIPAIGASDARTLILIGAAVVPIIGINGFINAMFGVCFLFILVSAAMTIYKRQVNPEVSFPMVPMFLAPFWMILLASPYLGFTPGFIY